MIILATDDARSYNIQEMEKEQNTPQFIKQLPWYAQDSKGGGELIKIPTLEPKGFIEDWYNRSDKGYQATSFRKGSCENCGAMGHQRKFCTERPRKVTAKYTNKNIAADDIVKDIRMNWQIKRDRWNGYTPEMYTEVIEDYKKYDEVRKKVKGDEIEDEMRVQDNPLLAATLPSANKKEKFQGLGGVRNREDRAKYLLNLDVNSAAFDPKSRTLAGEDEYLKELSNLQAVGEKASLEEQDRFTFEQVEKHHSELSSTALPTLTEKIFKSVKQKQAGLNSGKMGEIIRKYGAESTVENGVLKVVVEENQDEAYPRQRRVIKSKYEEDVFINDHTSVWGSWYNKHLGWGYHCCHSNQKMSYCMGIKGRERALARELKIKAQEVKELQKMKEMEAKVDDELANELKIKTQELQKMKETQGKLADDEDNSKQKEANPVQQHQF